jgi:cytochrome c biogenesis protein CcdA/glutaredoxin
MKKNKLMPIFFLMLFIISLSSTYAIDNNENNDKIEVYFFWGEGCPHCTTQKPFMENLQNQFPDIIIKDYETWQNQDNSNFFKQFAKDNNFEVRGVPTTFIEGKVWAGFSDRIGDEINLYLENLIENRNNNQDSVLVPCIHLFVDYRCPQCQKVEDYLFTLNNLDSKINIHDVNEDYDLFLSFKKHYNIIDSGLPILFIGGTILSGDSIVLQNAENEINKCLNEGCACLEKDFKSFIPQVPKQKDITPSQQNFITLPFVGDVDISSMSLLLSTVLIAFIDGFNPCSLWAMLFLLGIVLYTGSRKKVFIIGSTFLLVTTLVYGLFMLGLINVFKYVMYRSWILGIVSGIAILFGLINMKDFFWYKKGISFTIPDRFKPKIFKSARNIFHPDKKFSSMLIGTIILALGISLVELPCTAGFPVIWTNLLAQNQVEMSQFIFLFSIYILIYLLDELVFFFTVVFTMRATKFEEKHGKLLKLIGGTVMVSLGTVMIIDYNLLNNITTSLIIFGSAIGLSLIIYYVYNYFNKEGGNKNVKSK